MRLQRNQGRCKWLGFLHVFAPKALGDSRRGRTEPKTKERVSTDTDVVEFGGTADGPTIFNLALPSSTRSITLHR